MTGPLGWVETEATVTTCKYQFSRMNTLTLGIQTQGKFRITFDYYAHGKLYSDECQSTIAMPQDTRFGLSYNPLNPAENTRTSGPSAATRVPLLAVAIAGSVVLSLIWLAVLHGCN